MDATLALLRLLSFWLSKRRLISFEISDCEVSYDIRRFTPKILLQLMSERRSRNRYVFTNLTLPTWCQLCDLQKALGNALPTWNAGSDTFPLDTWDTRAWLQESPGPWGSRQQVSTGKPSESKSSWRRKRILSEKLIKLNATKWSRERQHALVREGESWKLIKLEFTKWMVFWMNTGMNIE